MIFDLLTPFVPFSCSPFYAEDHRHEGRAVQQIYHQRETARTHRQSFLGERTTLQPTQLCCYRNVRIHSIGTSCIFNTRIFAMALYGY